MPVAEVAERTELARRASSRKTRRVHFTPRRPCRWNPTSLCAPDSGEPFTPDSAWTFIVANIHSGAAVEVVVLRKPPGKRAFVMLLEGARGESIYIKLEILSDVVLGRSFHLSDPARNEDE